MQRNKLRFVLCVPGIVVTLSLCTAKPALTSEDVEKPSKHSGNYFWLSVEEQPALVYIFVHYVRPAVAFSTHQGFACFCGVYQGQACFRTLV